MVVEYLRAVMAKRISFRSPEERKEGAERMVREAEQLRFLFRKLASVSAGAGRRHGAPCSAVLPQCPPRGLWGPLVQRQSFWARVTAGSRPRGLQGVCADLPARWLGRVYSGQLLLELRWQHVARLQLHDTALTHPLSWEV